jgi:hypothetical protein
MESACSFFFENRKQQCPYVSQALCTPLQDLALSVLHTSQFHLRSLQIVLGSLCDHSMSPFLTRVVTPSDTFRTPFSCTSPPQWFKTSTYPTSWAAHLAHLSMMGDERGWEGTKECEQQYHQGYGPASLEWQYASMQEDDAILDRCDPLAWYGMQRASWQQYKNGSENLQIRRRKGEMRVVRRKGKFSGVTLFSPC